MPVSRGNMPLRKNKTLPRETIWLSGLRAGIYLAPGASPSQRQNLNWIFVLILQHRGVSVMSHMRHVFFTQQTRLQLAFFVL
jgi:hypothetical protein